MLRFRLWLIDGLLRLSQWLVPRDLPPQPAAAPARGPVTLAKPLGRFPEGWSFEPGVEFVRDYAPYIVTLTPAGVTVAVCRSQGADPVLAVTVQAQVFQLLLLRKAGLLVPLDRKEIV